MFDVIIPLRSGSKGLRDKNLQKFNKNILINHLLKKIIKLKDIRYIFILTDSEAYKKKIIKNKKINLEYIRKRKISGDNSKIFDLIKDFFIWADFKLLKLENILLLQATSPLLLKKEIDKTIQYIKKKKVNSLFHVTEMVEHPYECINISKKRWKYLKKSKKVNRQNFEKFYFITGSLYYFTKNFFNKHKKFYNQKSSPYKVDKINFIDIDTKFDIEIAKKISNLKIRN